ncbi:MAG: GNAT family N-acetyltransferase [Microthrixaceae bacterium]
MVPGRLLVVQIDRALDDDLDRIVALRLEFLADHRRTHGLDDSGVFDDAFVARSRRWVDDLQRQGRLHTWIASGDGRDVGLASVIVHDLPPRPEDVRCRDGRLLHVWVEPPLRGNGLGRELVERCIAAAGELELRTFSLHATDDGRPLYERLGFRAEPAWMERSVVREWSPSV